ncbi:hypothetical protein KDH_48930 [Dictyobacter sp. S3.2.2.5]|uniref:Uncharacterized protein n=1 Tax=Dictyobacter halimunensis TaxID=3026934 RepID=A0ABQ6FUW7_9CHLR|nr:hypothetical protein KDH_48930 [Dictyobacter sp. S3.2.2.5]
MLVQIILIQLVLVRLILIKLTMIRISTVKLLMLRTKFIMLLMVRAPLIMLLVMRITLKQILIGFRPTQTVIKLGAPRNKTVFIPIKVGLLPKTISGSPIKALWVRSPITDIAVVMDAMIATSITAKKLLL